MKKLLSISFALISMLSGTNRSAAQSVSTGLGAIGTVDGWKVGITSPALSNTYVLPTNMYAGIWEPTPACGTGAKWISLTTNGIGNGMTDYYYEKTFTVAPGINLLQSNFSVAVDDVLKSIELVKPNGVAINVPFIVNPTGYHFTKLVTEAIKCPERGEWKLRIKVFCGDPKKTQGPTALLVCGNMIQTLGNCCKIPDQKCNPAFTASTFTVNSQGNVVIDVNPTVTADAQHYWGLVGASGITDIAPIPLSTILSGGSFGLGISPTGTATPVGMGSGITGSTSHYGYHYEGMDVGKCFKITHYIKCCNKWYYQTKTFCTRLCTETKEAGTGAGDPKDIEKAETLESHGGRG